MNFVKFKNKKIAKFETPFTKKDYSEIINSDESEFIIHDKSTGKLKYYNIPERVLPQTYNLFDFNFSFINVLKISGLIITAVYTYKALKLPSKASKKIKDSKDGILDNIDNYLANFEKKVFESPEKKPPEVDNALGKPREKENTSSTSNGWTISAINK